MKFVINENQFNVLICEKNLLKRNKIQSLKKAILSGLMFGSLHFNDINQQIFQNTFLSDDEKIELLTFTIENDNRYWQEIADDVVFISYVMARNGRRFLTIETFVIKDYYCYSLSMIASEYTVQEAAQVCKSLRLDGMPLSTKL